MQYYNAYTTYTVQFVNFDSPELHRLSYRCDHGSVSAAADAALTPQCMQIA